MTPAFLSSLPGVSSLVCLSLNLAMTGVELRGEITSWVTLIGSIAITAVTVGLQVYHAIRDRDKDQKTDNQNERNDENG